MTRQFREVAALAAIAVLICLAPTAAQATLEINFNGTNNGTTIAGGTTCVGGTACDTSTTAGQLITTTALGTLTVTQTTGNSSSPTNGALTIQLNGTPSATGTFTLAISDNGFTSPIPTNIFLGADVSGNSAPNIGGTGVVGSVMGVGFFSNSNVDFATNGTATSAAGPVAFKAGSLDGSVGPFNSTSPYSLTEYITITITTLATTNNKTFQINGDVDTASNPSTVPEPASVTMLGSVLLFAVGAIRRKMFRA